MARFQHISGKRRVFVKLREAGIISRAELARQCSLTRPAVSAIIEELLAEGMVKELGPGHSTGGKPPIMLEFQPRSRCAIGIDLGGDLRIEGVICDLACGIVAADSMEYENDIDSILDAITRLVKRLRGRYSSMIPAGIGIAVSAIVNAGNEAISSYTLDVGRKNLARKVEALTGLPVKLERRPNAAAIAEALFGAGQNYKQMVYITSGRGVGAGIVIDGEIYRGSHGFSGEIGRMLLPDSRQLEAAARPSQLPVEYRSQTGNKVDFAQFMQLYHDGDAVAHELVRRNAEYLAYAAQVAANIFDPAAIVLGGDVLEFGDEHFYHFQKVLNQNSAAYNLGYAPEILRSVFGHRGVAVGGAQLILDELVF